MRDEWITQHIGSETEPRPGFEDELGELLRDEWQGIARPRIDIQGGRPMRRKNNIRNVAWIGAAAAAILAVIIVVKTRDSSDSKPITTEPTVVSAPDTTGPEPTAPQSTAPETTVPGSTTPDTATPSTPTTEVTTSSAPPPTTVPESTVPASTTPPTLPAGEVGFAPACEESARPDASTLQLDEADLTTFGPLDVQPAISFQLPYTYGPNEVTNSSVPSDRPASFATTDVVRVPGGFLFAIHADYDFFPGTILRLFDDDGGIRWQRCLTDTVYRMYVAPPTAGPAQAILPVTITAADGPNTYDTRVLDLATGEITGTVAELVRSQGIDPGDNFTNHYPADSTDSAVLYVPDAFRPSQPATDRLISIDLATMKATAYPLPDSLAGLQPIDSPFKLQTDGSPYLIGATVAATGEITDRHAAAHWADGAWVTERQPLPRDQSSYPQTDGDISVNFDPGNTFTGTPPALVGTDIAGNEIWRHDGVSSLNREGFAVQTNGGTTLAVGCSGDNDPATGSCAAPVMIALDAADGSTLWQKDGYFAVVTFDDGYAIVSDPVNPTQDPESDGWSVIDVRTGEAVPGQHWDETGTFGQGCCDDNTLFTAQFGGTIVSVNGRDVNIYFPQGTAS